MSEQAETTFTPEERAFLESIAKMLPNDRAARLRTDAEIAHVRRDGDFVSVDVPGYNRPERSVQRDLPFEGRLRSADSGAVSIFVNMDKNDRLLEVEFVWWESLSRELDWSTLRIVPEAPIGQSTW